MCAVAVFGILSATLLIIDVSTGGRIKTPDGPDSTTNDTPSSSHLGKYNGNVLFPIVCVYGIVYGMVELIRRVIPRDIVGGNIRKLRQMDALVNCSHRYQAKLI